MTASADHSFAARRAGDIRLITGVSAAHFMSHYYMLVLPPLFAFVRQDYGVSYTELGLALTMFNAASAVSPERLVPTEWPSSVASHWAAWPPPMERPVPEPRA